MINQYQSNNDKVFIKQYYDKKMKIVAIFTIFEANNIGAYLQAYSLMTVVKRMGIEDVYIGKNIQVGHGSHNSSIFAKLIK